MDESWLDREKTFEELEIPLGAEMECLDDMSEKFNNGLPYMEELDPDAAWIKAVASGEYMHSEPVISASPMWDDPPVSMPQLPDQARLACFAELMGWNGEFDEKGYLKAVVQNKAGKAAVIKDIAGIRSSADEE